MHARGPSQNRLAQDADSWWLADRDEILASYLQLLRGIRSPLLGSVELTAQVSAQLYSVIDAVAATRDGTVQLFGRIGSIVGDEGLSEAIGRNRASSGVHPSQSLEAAALIFEAALPKMARRLARRGDPSPELTAGRLLNAAILDRMALAARAYVDHLLGKAYTSTRDERRRLSRELHDVAAPAVAVGLQNLELFDLYVESDPQRAGSKLLLASQERDARRVGYDPQPLGAVSRERRTGRPTRCHRALPRDSPDRHPYRSAHRWRSQPTIRRLFRGAVPDRSRGGTQRCRPRPPQYVGIAISVADGTLQAQVHNDGASFRVAGMLNDDRHVGVDSMRERADLLGARLEIASAPENGTTVSVRIPLPVPGPSRARQ